MKALIRSVWHALLQFLGKAHRGICHFFRLPVNIHGLWIHARLANSKRIEHHILSGSYERSEIHALRTALLPGDRVLEVGSGLGLTACFAAKRLPEGKVLSFEANPQLVEIASSHQRLNRLNNIEFKLGILHECSGALPFYVHDDFWISSLSPAPNTSEIKTYSHDLSQVLIDFQPTLVLMDIEGGEYDLLKLAAWSTNFHTRKFIVEFHPIDDARNRLKATGLFEAPWHSDKAIDEVIEAIERGVCTVTFSK